MPNLNQVAQILSEKEILVDSLISQKSLTSSYNTYAGECVNSQLRSTMLNILDDEHCIQAEIFSELQSNGWYKTEPADQNKVQQTRMKYSRQP